MGIFFPPFYRTQLRVPHGCRGRLRDSVTSLRQSKPRRLNEGTLGFLLLYLMVLIKSCQQRLDYAQAILRRWFRRDVAQNRLRIGFDEQNSPNPGHARGTVERDFSKKEHGDGP